MKNDYSLIWVLTLCLLFFSCSPKLGASYVFPTYEAKTYTKIAVIGIGDDLTARNAFEQNAVQLLQNSGINAIEGIKIFIHGESYSEEESIQILKEAGVDGVITMALVNENQSQRYVPGQRTAIPTGIARFGRYYYQTYSYVTAPGYYQDENQYLIEAILYDIAANDDNDALAWTGQSSLLNPSSSQDAAVTFTEQMVGTLVNDLIILK